MLKRMKVSVVLALSSLLLPTAGHASTKLLRHRDPSGSVYSTSNIYSCPYETPVKTLMSTYDYCGDGTVIIIGDTYCGHYTGGPTPTCGANPYKITSDLYKDGTLIASRTTQGSGAWAQHSFDGMTLSPGTYYVMQTLERRRGSCIGWTTVETVMTNSIYVGAYANAATVCFANPASGTRVRLRNKATGKCMYATGGDGRTLSEWSCWDDPAFNFVLEAVGGGKYRIRWEADFQCTYTVSTTGDYARHWVCWDDPNMNFGLIPVSGGGYRLWHFNNARTLYSNNDGSIRSTVDSSSNNAMVYYLDPVTMSGGWTDWLDRDDPSGSGDYETLSDFPSSEVCEAPTGIICQTVNGDTSWDVGEGPTVTCGASTGLACVNTNQPDGYCEDYRVRFYCP